MSTKNNMTYDETVKYLFNATPLFQNIGSGAYKEGLYNTWQLDKHFGHPHTKFKTIHVAGTNGKGSCSHTLAAILQSAGYKVGLFTSPHLVDFRERIRVNGKMIDEQFVVDFVDGHRAFFEPLHPSFFELTTAMAFCFFAEQKIDVAVVEVGLGGRLDCTNIITPQVCVITNISFDHVALLGDSLEKIAAEKAGIIKAGVPVVVGEALPDTRPVFENKAQSLKAPLYFAEESNEIQSVQFQEQGGILYETAHYGKILGALSGACQTKNTNTILCAVGRMKEAGFSIPDEAVKKGFTQVCETTGLMGRWQKLQIAPLVICDTGHNIAGIQYVVKQLKQMARPLRIVLGMVNDKDISGVLAMMPKEATYYFCQANVKRALPHDEIKKMAESYQLLGNSYHSVSDAYTAALEQAESEDCIFIGGSSFIVADLLAYLPKRKMNL